jgi:uncharacterized protein YutE (UPF0331/DUF86 family)
MPDPEKIRSGLQNLKTYRQHLLKLAQIGQTEFLSDPIVIGAAKYYLLISIECCLDIAHHLIASGRFRFPEDYADAFQVLYEQGILPEPLAQRLQQMARFRNLLVHQYAKTDDARVYQILQQNLGDFSAFAREIVTSR